MELLDIIHAEVSGGYKDVNIVTCKWKFVRNCDHAFKLIEAIMIHVISTQLLPVGAEVSLLLHILWLELNHYKLSVVCQEKKSWDLGALLALHLREQRIILVLVLYLLLLWPASSFMGNFVVINNKGWRTIETLQKTLSRVHLCSCFQSHIIFEIVQHENSKLINLCV